MSVDIVHFVAVVTDIGAVRSQGDHSGDTVSCTFSYHAWQFIIFTIFIITACIFSYSLSISF